MFRYLKSKANPAIGAAEQLYTGKDFVGQLISKARTMASLFTPLSGEELYDALTTEGATSEDALILLNFFGFGVNQYNDKAKAKAQAKGD